MNGEKLEKIQLDIGKVKKMRRDGYGYLEIAMKLKLPESTIRNYAGLIDSVELNKA